MTFSGKTKFVIVMVLMIGTFLGGFIPGYLQNRALLEQIEQAQGRLTQVQERLEVATLQNDLGMILIEVEQNNFGSAKDKSTKFFDDLRQLATSLHNDQLRERIAAILHRRDEITSDLTALNPETAAKLRTLYVDLHRADTINK